jgi:transcriptional repressor NrdR
MKCPYCSNLESKVVDSRIANDSASIRRRRECEKCGKRYTTYERVQDNVPIVVKKDGRREEYDRVKLVTGITKACEKRPVSVETIEQVADGIERHLQDMERPEVESSVIGEKVMEALHGLDEVAYVRFASVYRSFKDINEFMDELKDVLKDKGA